MKEYQKNSAYQKISSKKKQMIEKLEANLIGKTLSESLPLVISWKKELEAEHIVFTKEENKLLTDILTSQMNPAQKKQYELLKPLLQKKWK